VARLQLQDNYKVATMYFYEVRRNLSRKNPSDEVGHSGIDGGLFRGRVQNPWGACSRISATYERELITGDFRSIQVTKRPRVLPSLRFTKPSSQIRR